MPSSGSACVQLRPLQSGRSTRCKKFYDASTPGAIGLLRSRSATRAGQRTNDRSIELHECGSVLADPHAAQDALPLARGAARRPPRFDKRKLKGSLPLS